MKLVTINLDCQNDWQLKKDKLLGSLKSIDPDILCVQELSSKQENVSRKFTNEGIEIQSELNMDGYFSAAYKCSPNQGLFIKSEICCVIKNYHFSFAGILPSGEIEKHRRFLIAQLFEVNGKELLVINLHLSVGKDFRFDNWRQILLWLNSSGLISKNILIVGDFNTYEKHDIDELIEEDGFSNCWKELHSEGCITYRSSDWWIENHPDSRHAKAIEDSIKRFPSSCLDYIFHKGDFRFNEIEYLDLVPDVTDHLGLVLDFDMV